MAGKSQEISNQQRNQLAEHIIDALKNNPTEQWKMGWDPNLFAPRNPCTKNTYRGINRLWLSFWAEIQGYGDPRWVTFNEAKTNGWQIEKGAKATYVEKWGPCLVRHNPETDKSELLPWNKVKPSELPQLLEQGWKKIYTMQRVSPVFNASQVKGIPSLDLVTPHPKGREELYEIADRFINLSECPVEEELVNTSSFYAPKRDVICLPPRDVFYSGEDFLATLWHEMGHSTGHESRMNRTLSVSRFDPAYAREELNAELSAMFTQASVGVGEFGKTIENSVSYLQSWASSIPATGDEREAAIKEVLGAITTAGQISDYICNPYFDKYPQPDLDPNIQKIMVKNKNDDKENKNDKYDLNSNAEEANRGAEQVEQANKDNAFSEINSNRDGR